MRYHQDTAIGLFSSDERLSELTQLGDPLLCLAQHIDFEFFRDELEASLYSHNDGSKGGQPPFDPVVMFKVLVLQRLYNLSDDAAEYQIKDRLSFMRFLGLDFSSRVPDAKTVWLFRENLQRCGLVKKLFDGMNCELERQGIITNAGQIVDASFASAPRQRNTREENKEIKAGLVPASWAQTPHRLRQKDTDARWAKKGDETHYGYKDHVLCDRESKLITEYIVTDAALHDSAALWPLLDTGRAEGQELYADSAYRSAEIEEHLVGCGIESQIHEKAYRNRPLDEQQKASNKEKSRVRARVEHVFGFVTNSMNGFTVRGRSLERNEAVIGLMNLTYNLCRITQLHQKLSSFPAGSTA